MGLEKGLEKIHGQPNIFFKKNFEFTVESGILKTWFVHDNVQTKLKFSPLPIQDTKQKGSEMPAVLSDSVESFFSET